MFNEKRNDLASGSATNYCYLVLSHLQGVNPPNMNPLSDLANNKVGALPTQCYLKDALWKLCSLALNISLAPDTFKSACENICPKHFIYYFGKWGLTYLNIPVRSIGPACCSQYGKRASIFYLCWLIKVNPEGQNYDLIDFYFFKV